MADFSRFFENAENFRPQKEGRAPQVLMQAPVEPRKLKSEGEEARRRLEKERTGEDALQAYVNYIRKLKELHPAGGTVVNNALYDAAMQLHDVPQFKNDPRLLNIFLEYADKQSDPRETFEFMRENQIAGELTNFHLAMAAAFERAKDFTVAEKAYSEAVTVGKRRGIAGEIDLAMKHLAHFKRRMTRRLQETRALHGPSSPEAARALMVARSAAAQHARQQQQLPPSSARVVGAGMGQAGVVSTKRPAVGPTAPRAPQFTIHEDRRMGSARHTRPAEASWKVLETESTGIENQGPAVPWTEAGTITGTRAAPSVKPPSFTIWTEPSETESAGRSVEETSQRMENLHLDESVARTPMMGQASAGALMTSALMPASAAGMSTPPSNNQDDRTINTRMALNDMFEMFASPSMSVARPAQPVNFPLFTPANGLATRLAEDEEGQNVSPNVMLRPGETGATLRRSTLRRPISTRPVLATIEHHDEGMSPSFRRELINPPAHVEEGFKVYQETPTGAGAVRAGSGGRARRTGVQQPQSRLGMRRDAPLQESSLPIATATQEPEREEDLADVTYDGGTLGISRVLAFDPVTTQSVSRPRMGRMISSTTKPTGGATAFQIFKD